MSRKQLKTLAKEQLGNQLFGNNWLIALVVLLIGYGLLSAAGFTFVGPMILVGPISFGIAKLFLKQTSDKKQMNIVGLFDGFNTDFTGNLVLGLLRDLVLASHRPGDRQVLSVFHGFLYQGRSSRTGLEKMS